VAGDDEAYPPPSFLTSALKPLWSSASAYSGWLLTSPVCATFTLYCELYGDGAAATAAYGFGAEY